MTNDFDLNGKAREYWLRLETAQTCACDDQDTIWTSKPLNDIPEHIIHVIDYDAYEKRGVELYEQSKLLQQMMNTGQEQIANLRRQVSIYEKALERIADPATEMWPKEIEDLARAALEEGRK